MIRLTASLVPVLTIVLASHTGAQLFAQSVGDRVLMQSVRSTAHVHDEFLPNDFTEFRLHASDHLPVTIRIRVVADSDS